MLVVSGSIIDCGIDYITLSNVTDTDQVNRTLDDMFEPMLRDCVPKEVKWGGYKGLTVSHARLGTRTRAGKVDKILVVSGQQAHDLVMGLEQLPNSIRCTRIDLQMTVLRSASSPELAGRYYAIMKADPTYKSAMVGRRAITLYDSLNGQTLYIGRRTSKSLFVRFYDKGGILGEQLGRKWRLEVEFKRVLALPVLETILGGVNVASTVEKIIVQYAQNKCGILLPSSGGEDVGKIKALGREKNTIEWLERCVRPVVVREINYGNADEVIGALGMSWLLGEEQIKQRALNQVSKGGMGGILPS